MIPKRLDLLRVFFLSPCLAAMALIWLIGCATESYKMSDRSSRPEAILPPPAPPKVDENLGLETSLGMHRLADDLGWREKSFNPCSFGLSSNDGCHTRYLTVVHFQILCRDSEGTISTTPNEIRPIVSNNLRWDLVGMSGDTQTDANGYGEFSLISDRSTRGQRLIVHVGLQFFVVEVSEIGKLVLPKNFCSG